MRTYDASDAQTIVAEGVQYRKLTTIHAIHVPEGAIVHTEEGKLEVEQDAYIATDGERVWPVSADYMRKNYEAVR